jgi:dolichyl-diphosphooligosaccharide--protein glycosyltransferase
MDLHFLIFLFPAGVVMCFRTLRDEHIFVIIYAVVASYFAGVMVRLMLTLTPVVCVSAAVALSSLMDTYLDPSEPNVEDDKNESSTSHSTGTTPTTTPATSKKTKKNKEKEKEVSAPAGSVLGELVSNVASSAVAAKSATTAQKGIFGMDTRLIVILNSLGLLLFFVVHCTWVTSNAYSSPSVVLSSTSPDGSKNIIDDFREAYHWLRQNTAEDAVVMSWWDYGYQIAGMADRPTLVDNNTWNNSEFLP